MRCFFSTEKYNGHTLNISQGCMAMPYQERVKCLGRERYYIIKILIILEGLTPNFSNPITSGFFLDVEAGHASFPMSM